jgi:nucleotide-binding universal stress UspA family protein
METAILSNRIEQVTECGLKKIVVGYDASPAAERALHDAITIGKRFSAEILLAQANPPDEDPASCDVLRDERMREVHDLEVIRGQLAEAGLSSRSIVRNGIVGDTLFNICCEENADLLLLGAYGFSVRDRQTLGSTAEFLLRAVPCPTLTYGPEVRSAFDDVAHKGPVLVPVALPCDPGYLKGAMKITKLFGIALELLHVAEHVPPTVVQNLERECQQLTDRLRGANIRAQWSLFCGAPDSTIRSRAGEIDSPFILMPLKWGHRLSSMTSDNVAAHVIRCSKIPVMTYRAS